jgi:hypothetical protein
VSTRKPRSGKVRYPGELGKRAAPARLVDTILGGGISEEHRREFLQASLGHTMRGLALLFHHYKIEGDDTTAKLMLLVLRLAGDHVPFFQAAALAKPGTKVNHLEYTRLELDVMAEKRPSDRGDTPALTRLVTGSRRYKTYAKAGGVETLRKRLQRARKDPFTKFVRKVAQALPQFRVGADRKAIEDAARVLGQVR